MNKSFIILLVSLISVLFASCKKNDPPLPDNVVQFNFDEQGFDAGVNELEIKINASRAVDAATGITISIESEGVMYGTEFTTEPAAVNNIITLNIPSGSSDASFKVKKAANVFLEGNEKINFRLTEVSQPVLTGETADLQLSFSAITSVGSALQLEGGLGGASAVNTVFVDLSANRQTPVARDSWDLGFYSGSSFRVITNSTNGASAIMLSKTDLNQVSSVDINPDNLKLGFGQGSFALYDDVSGDLAKTVIAEIAPIESDNKVYIINRKGGSGTVLPVADLVKVRVIRKDNGYTLQYAKINETNYKSIDIAKNANYNFLYVSFDNGAVSVEPLKDKWDIHWGWSMYFTGTTPYGFSDLIFLNHQVGVEAAEVLTNTVSYTDFKESNLSNVTFSKARDVIGSKWRITSGGPIGVQTDRFYVVKDVAGNIYKLKFISFHANDGGERGKPKLEYALVKKSS